MDSTSLCGPLCEQKKLPLGKLGSRIKFCDFSPSLALVTRSVKGDDNYSSLSHRVLKRMANEWLLVIGRQYKAVLRRQALESDCLGLSIGSSPSCATLGKLPNFSVLQFPCLPTHLEYCIQRCYVRGQICSAWHRTNIECTSLLLFIILINKAPHIRMHLPASKMPSHSSYLMSTTQEGRQGRGYSFSDEKNSGLERLRNLP